MRLSGVKECHRTRQAVRRRDNEIICALETTGKIEGRRPRGRFRWRTSVHCLPPPRVFSSRNMTIKIYSTYKVSLKKKKKRSNRHLMIGHVMEYSSGQFYRMKIPVSSIANMRGTAIIHSATSGNTFEIFPL